MGVVSKEDSEEDEQHRTRLMWKVEHVHVFAFSHAEKIGETVRGTDLSHPPPGHRYNGIHRVENILAADIHSL